MKTARTVIGIFCLSLFSCINQPPGKYPADPGRAGPEAAAIRLPPEVMPVIGCWFWIDRVPEPSDYEPYLDKISRHAPYNLLTTSFRIPEREIRKMNPTNMVR